MAYKEVHTSRAKKCSVGDTILVKNKPTSYNSGENSEYYANTPLSLEYPLTVKIIRILEDPNCKEMASIQFEEKGILYGLSGMTTDLQIVDPAPMKVETTFIQTREGKEYKKATIEGIRKAFAKADDNYVIIKKKPTSKLTFKGII